MGDLNIPETGAESLVFVLFLGAMAYLWVMVRRRRERSEREYWERRKTSEQRLPEPDDPRELPKQPDKPGG